MRKIAAAGALALALSAGACGPQSAVTESSAAEAAVPAAAVSAEAATPTVDGRPMWSSNRTQTAEENAQEAFERNGADFGAADLDAYVRMAHAFTTSPPKGAETLKRANGDTLIYDAQANVFAVATKDGAPRTMFKPRDGAAYWAQQKEREAARANAG